MIISSRNDLKMFFELFVCNDSPKKFYHGKLREFILEKLNEFVPGDFSSINEQKYWLLNDIFERPICPTCKVNPLKFLGNRYRDHCSCACSTKDKNVKAKSDQTREEKYGENHIEIIKERQNNARKQTMIKKYGVDHNFKLPGFVEQRNETQRKKYNGLLANQAPEVIDKKQKALFIKYGVKTLGDVASKLMQERYGVNSLLQIPEYFDQWSKNAYKWKSMKMPSGTEIKVQGYEPFAVALLLQSYNEDELIFNKSLMPRFTYQDPINLKTRRYYPDIYIPKDRLIIEVKSEYTLSRNYENTLLKLSCVKEAGYNFDLLCFDRRGNIIPLPF